MIPEISRSSVVLPEPLRPTSPTAPPGSIRKETSFSATTSVGRERRAGDDRVLQPARLARVHPEAARRTLRDDLTAWMHAPRVPRGPAPARSVAVFRVSGSRRRRSDASACASREHGDEARIGVRHLDATELEPELLAPSRPPRGRGPSGSRDGRRRTRPGRRAHGARRAPCRSSRWSRMSGPEPRLARRRLALERERPVAEPGPLRDEPGRLQQLLLVDRRPRERAASAP